MPDGYPLSFVSLAGGSVAHQGSMMKCRVDPTFADRGVIFCTPKTIGGAITGGSTKKKNPAFSNPRKDLLELDNPNGYHSGTWESIGNFYDF